MSHTPLKGQEVEIQYQITDSSNKVLNSTDSKPNFRFILGDNKVYPEIEEMLYKMERGQVAETTINTSNSAKWLGVNESEEVKCKVTWVDFHTKTKSVYEMDNIEKYNISRDLKAEGVELFKKGEYDQSLAKFKESWDYLSKVHEKDYTEETTTLKISCMLNSCNCNNKLRNYTASVGVATKWIEIKNDIPKCYYYRGVANAYLDEFDKAGEDFTKWVELLKSDKDEGVVSWKNWIESRRVAKENKEKSKLKSFFKNGLWDEEKK